MNIRTKIVATVGPACAAIDALREVARAGCDVFRINFSHGTEAEHAEALDNIRTVEAELGRPKAVMGDLCGPKIRVGAIAGGSVLLAEGQEISIQREAIEGRADRICTTLAELGDLVSPGETILLDDGKMRLEVAEADGGEEFICRVVRGGVLASGKGVNLPGGVMDLPALTEKDRRDVAWLTGRGFDYVAQSFVRSAEDIAQLRKLLDEAGCDAHIVAKIEKPQAIENIAQIVGAADAIMVARGDLGVEMALPAVPITQKRIAHLCQTSGKPCIIATQMLESMTSCATPTRAEVSDVANAVLDHADAVMLSGETAVGKFPVESVRMMNDVVASIQAYHDTMAAPTVLAYAPEPTAAALAAAVREIIAIENIAAVAVFTISGTTARMFAKHRLPCPILGISPHEAAVRRMCLYYGVQAVQGKTVEHTREVLDLATEFALLRKIAKPGDKMVVVSGRPLGRSGQTNTLVVHTIPGQ